MYQYKLIRDINGNKRLSVSIPTLDCKGFSVQTNGHLPKTHRMTNATLNEHIAENELLGYIKEFGTNYQKDFLSIS